MKTMVMDYAKTLDNAIEDVNVEYAIEAGTKIGNDIYNATMLFGLSMLCIGDATIQTTKLAVRSAKTGTKKMILKAAEIYDEKATTIIIRR